MNDIDLRKEQHLIPPVIHDIANTLQTVRKDGTEFAVAIRRVQYIRAFCDQLLNKYNKGK